MAKKFETLLSDASRGPLSFFVIMSAWDDAEAYIIMDQSKFKVSTVLKANCNHNCAKARSCCGVLVRLHQRHFLRLGTGQHIYVEGDQHLTTTGCRHWNSKHVTAAFILQNEKGCEKWPVEKKLAHLQRAFADSHEH